VYHKLWFGAADVGPELKELRADVGGKAAAMAVTDNRKPAVNRAVRLIICTGER